MNKVVEGKFRGKKIYMKNGNIYLYIGFEKLPISNEIIKSLQVLNIEHYKDGWDQFLRSRFSFLFDPNYQFAFIRNAKERNIYLIKIIYRNGQCSIVKTDENIFNRLSSIIFVRN